MPSRGHRRCITQLTTEETSLWPRYIAMADRGWKADTVDGELLTAYTAGVIKVVDVIRVRRWFLLYGSGLCTRCSVALGATVGGAGDPNVLGRGIFGLSASWSTRLDCSCWRRAVGCAIYINMR